MKATRIYKIIWLVWTVVLALILIFGRFRPKLLLTMLLCAPAIVAISLWQERLKKLAEEALPETAKKRPALENIKITEWNWRVAAIEAGGMLRRELRLVEYLCLPLTMLEMMLCAFKWLL